MASSLPSYDLTKSKEFGRYEDGSRDGKVQRGEGDRTVTMEEEMALMRKCEGCDKPMKKARIPLACSCKAAIFCSEGCRQSSEHNCGGTGDEEYDERDKAAEQCHFLYRRMKELNQGPSSSSIEKVMARTKGDQEILLLLAEAEDPIAAYIVGEAYAYRRTLGNQLEYVFPTFKIGFIIPTKFEEVSFSETTEIAVKWLKIAAEGGVPEAMYLLSRLLDGYNGLITDRRLSHQWLDKAYRTGKMDYLVRLLECSGLWLPAEFENMFRSIANQKGENIYVSFGPTLAHLLMATRCLEIRDWCGKTAMAEPFYSRVFFSKFMDVAGWNLERKDTQNSSLIFSNKMSLTIAFVAGRPGCSNITNQVVHKERYEVNPRFLQGVKTEFNPDYQLIRQTLKNGVLPRIEGRTVYLVGCKHNKDIRSVDDLQVAGECQLCSGDALQRLQAVDKGQYSITIAQTIPRYGYHARYVKEDGTIVQDMLKAYSKPDMRQILQCLMINPADLHPAAVTEDQNLYWTIVWYWGSVFHAVEDTCDRNTLEAIYHGLAHRVNKTAEDSTEASIARRSEDSTEAPIARRSEDSTEAHIAKRSDSSALAAFPESAAGEWRIACGNQDCPRVDHQIKFSLCSGCKVRRYCNEECQKKDWVKHKQFCKTQKGGS